MAFFDKLRKIGKKKEEPAVKASDKKRLPQKEKAPVKTAAKAKSKAPVGAAAKIKKQSSSVPVWVYKIIERPHISEKASFLAEKGSYVFKVFSTANKTEVQKAVEALYRVKVQKVRMVHVPSKKRRVGRHQGWRHGLKKGYKKAIVTLVKGEKIEIV